jgi:hypothetical protein
VKLPLYAAAGALWLFGVWYCLNLTQMRKNPSLILPISFVIGLLLSALTMPHLLYYDLCLLLPAGVLVLARRGPLPAERELRGIAVAGWVAVSGFFPILIAFAGYKAPPLILEVILLGLFGVLLWRLNQSSNMVVGR